MSWTTAAPVPSLTSRNSMPPKPNPQPSSSEPTLIPVPTANSPAIGPKPLSLLSSGPISTPRSRTPIAPGKLAKLANALGVSTPNPPSSPSPYPLRSPGTQSLTSFGTSTTPNASAPSRHLLHVIPPVHLPSSSPEDDDDPDYRAQFRRGTLVAVHPTLQSQMVAIAREYALPSTGGMILYLITDGPGPRITDEAWKMLWSRVRRADREAAGPGPLSISGGSSYSSRSGTPALIANGYPSPASPAGSVRKLSRRPSEECDSYDSHSLLSSSPSMGAASVYGLGMGDLPSGAFNFANTSALPILAKVEFDIDKRKAPWYEPWRQRRRLRAESSASAAGSVSDARRARELVLGHGRRKSGGLEEVKRRLVGAAHIPPPPRAQMEVEIQQPKPQAAFVVQVGQEDESESGEEGPASGGSPEGYLPLPDVEEEDDKLKSPLTGRALRRESMIPLEFDTVVQQDNDAPEESDNGTENADPTVTHVSVAQEQEEEDEESDYEEEAVVMDGRQLLREGEDPLADVFPSDEQTWAQMANDAPPDTYERYGPAPVIPELSLGGGLVPPSATHQEEASNSDVSGGDDDNPEDVISLWKAKYEPKIDEQGQTLRMHTPANLDKSLPPSPTEPHGPPQKSTTAKHVPPPLVLVPSVSSNGPQVIVAPPSAGPEPGQGRSYLAYLDEKKDSDPESPESAPAHDQVSRPPLPGIEAIEILVNGPSGLVLLQDGDDDDESVFGGARSAFADNNGSEGHENELSRPRAGSLVGSEEYRSKALDELEKEIVGVSPKRWDDDESLDGSTFAAAQKTPQTSCNVENPVPASAETPKALPPTPPKVLPPTPPEMSSAGQQATQEGDEARHTKVNEIVSPIHHQPSRWSTSSSSDCKLPSPATPPIGPIKTKSSPPSPSAEGTSEGEHQRITQTSSPVNSPTREVSSPGLELSPDPFVHKPHRFGTEDPEDELDCVEALASLPRAPLPRAPPTRRSTSSSIASITSPPRASPPRHMVTSRFSQDSTTEDDTENSKAPRERTNSIISLKGVRNLWRKSGGGGGGGPPAINTVVVRHNGLPLMSPGLNGHTTPQTRFNEEVPPVPSMGFFQHGSGVMPSLPSSSKAPTGEKHHRPDSGLDPFHFDQDSRYPVRRTPLPATGYISDLVPPPASSPVVAGILPPRPPTPTGKTKGILKGWVSRSKRADSAASTSMSSPIEPSPVTQGKGSTSKKRPINIDMSGVVQSMNKSEFAPSPHTAIPRELVGLGIAEKQSSPTSLLQSPVVSEPRESIDTTTRLSDFEIVSPAPGRQRRGTDNKI